MLWESLPREPIHVPRDALQRETVLPAVQPGVVTLPAAERLAARLYADLIALAARIDGAGLGRALFGRTPDDPTPEPLEDDPWLTPRLVAADVEQLWRDQLIAAAALALVSDVTPAADATTLSAGVPSADADVPTARCLLVYRMRPTSPVADALGPMGSDRSTHPPELAAGARQAPLQLLSRLRARLALLLSWTPAIARRSWAFPRSVYTFHWEPARAITLGRDSPSGADDHGANDQWTICRLRRPSVLR
ncbi:MAG TPA: hypothetical protein VF116_03910 [Ktedonobacterales bacterium]